ARAARASFSCNCDGCCGIQFQIMRALLSVVIVALAGSPAGAAPQTLTLDDAIRIARAHHPSVEATRAQLEAARARLSQARSQFLPGITGSFSYQPQTANFALSPGFKRLLDRPSSGIASVLSTSGVPITAQ